MKISIPGLGGRLQRARKSTGLSQEAVADRIGVSWMTVHRWERSQRGVSDTHLDLLCDLYNKPLRWFLTLEEGDLGEESGSSGKEPSTDANKLSRKIADAPADQRPMIEKVVEDMLDGLMRTR
ncbi:MAG: helix-turn-helix transcriptional regulator [Chloroflexi bacterium]|nr:helix-turn-helix transcriptional regulator [Chloroflexota bacterium]